MQVVFIDLYFFSGFHVTFLSFFVQEEEVLRTFNKQLEEDRRIVISRSNLNELHKVGNTWPLMVQVTSRQFPSLIFLFLEDRD